MARGLRHKPLPHYAAVARTATCEREAGGLVLASVQLCFLLEGAYEEANLGPVR